jgi:fructuronate reductase
VVHFGPGAFFRAHQAVFFDRLLGRDLRWGISGVALHSSGVRDALIPQDGLYSLAELDQHSQLRVIGSLRELLVASQAPDQVMARLAAPSVRLVTLTVTEKGYCLGPDGRLDLDDRAVRHDLEAHQSPPLSLVGWLAAGLRARRLAGLPPFVTLSCDNLSDNGGKLRRAVIDFAERRGDTELAAWIETTARFPRTMVDSITPATDDALRHQVAQGLGLDDAWPIQRETFCQWVIEDVLGDDGPDLAAVGATLTPDVGRFEQAKLRLLNGAHSTLAYIGRLAGLVTVAEAMATPALAGFVTQLMQDDIAPTLQEGGGLDLAVYGAAIRARFANPSLRHELAQIAWDGSQKLPVRLLATIADLLASGRPVARIAIPVAAWMLFVRAQLETGRVLVDPLSAQLSTCVKGNRSDDVTRFLAVRDVFPAELANSATLRAALTAAHAGLYADPLGALTSVP